MTVRSEQSARQYRLSEIIEAIAVPAAAAFDRHAHHIAVNAAFAELLGIGGADVVPVTLPGAAGMPYHFEVDGRPILEHEAPLVRGARGETVTGMSIDLVRDDGVRHHLFGWATPLFDIDGVPNGALCVFQDVGLQVAAEGRYRDLTELTPALTYTVDANGAIDFVNRRWSEMTGADVSQLHGEGWKRFVHPEDRERAAFAAPMSEWRLRSADGSYRWLRVRAEPSYDAAGRIVRWFGSGFDVDDLHRALDAMQLLGVGGATLAADHDVPTMLGDIAGGAFGSLADVCIFDLLEPGGGDIVRLAMTAPGIDPSLADLARERGRPSLHGETEHHPALDALLRGETTHVPIVDAAFLERAVTDEGMRAAWEAIGLHSFVVVPIRSTGRTLGALTMLRMRADRRSFDASDVRVIEAIGSRAGVAIEKVRLADAARTAAAASDDRYRSIADVMPQLMWTKEADGRLDWCNLRWYEYVGRAPEDGPYDGDDLYHPADVGMMRRRWRLSQRTGDPFEMEFRIRRSDGAYRWFLTRATCVRDASGRIARWYGSDTDVDDVRRAARSLQVFADLGEALTESLGLQATVDAAMTIVVPEFADWAWVNLIDESGDLRVAATYHSDASKRAVLGSQIGEVYARLDANVGSPLALRRREPLLLSSATFADAARVVAPGVLEAFWEVGFNSVLAVPLIVAGTIRGSLNVAMNESDRAFVPRDVPFFEELALRFAPAIANAELYERERRVARSFQDAALPAELPSIPGFTFDAIYEAGRAEALIGGDWYDAFRLADGRVVISIGDVAGSGLRAAVTMSNVRQAIRGVAQVHADPALMLEAADRTLRAETPDRFVTAFVAVIDGIGRTFSYASAGHPPPLVRLENGTVEELECGGLPLGLRENVRGGGRSMLLPEHATFVFYTDGLIESTHDMDEGERRLRAALADPAIANAPHPALAIHDAVLVEGSRDDVAILTVAIGEPPDFVRWEFEALDADASHRVQRELGRCLEAAGFVGDRLVICELVLAELVGNTVRYAPGPVGVFLERGEGVAVVHVLDRGPGFEFAARLPPDVYSESGRGLFLIASLAEDLHVVRRPDGGSHARVVLR